MWEKADVIGKKKNLTFVYVEVLLVEILFFKKQIAIYLLRFKKRLWYGDVVGDLTAKRCGLSK